MRNPFRFFVELAQQPLWMPIWVFFLVMVNVASVGFWDEPLAKLILVTFLINSVMMMGLYARFGFEKILGLGHMLWILLLVYVWIHIAAVEPTFRKYLIVLSISIAVSLVFDIIDVWNYFKAKRNAGIT